MAVPIEPGISKMTFQPDNYKPQPLLLQDGFPQPRPHGNLQPPFPWCLTTTRTPEQRLELLEEMAYMHRSHLNAARKMPH